MKPQSAKQKGRVLGTLGKIKKCLNCNKEFIYGNAQFGFRRKYCSKKCIINYWRKKHYKQHKEGTKKWLKDNPDYYKNYNKLNSKKIIKIRNRHLDKYFGGIGLRDKILKQSKYICQICDKKRVKFNIHHIDLNKNNNIIENLITLCIPCHSTEHYYISGNGWSFILNQYVT